MGLSESGLLPRLRQGGRVPSNNAMEPAARHLTLARRGSSRNVSRTGTADFRLT
jgi:hypothetical protein